MKWLCFIILIYLFPLILLFIGVLRKKESNGLTFFMTGSFLALMLYIPIIFYLPLSKMNDNAVSLFSVTLMIGGMVGSYHLFYFMRNYQIRHILSASKQVIKRCHNADLPSCDKIIMEEIESFLLSKPQIPDTQNMEQYSMELVYTTCRSLLSSARFHTSVTSGLISKGEQLMYIAKQSLSILFNKHFISDSCYENELNILEDLQYHDFFEGPQPYY